MERIIEIENLDKSFGKIHAVNDLSFSVRRGELFAFLGVNGAGKSTTISIICAQLAKDSGKVIVCGEDIDKDPSRVASRLARSTSVDVAAFYFRPASPLRSSTLSAHAMGEAAAGRLLHRRARAHRVRRRAARGARRCGARSAHRPRATGPGVGAAGAAERARCAAGRAAPLAYAGD